MVRALVKSSVTHTFGSDLSQEKMIFSTAWAGCSSVIRSSKREVTVTSWIDPAYICIAVVCR